MKRRLFIALLIGSSAAEGVVFLAKAAAPGEVAIQASKFEFTPETVKAKRGQPVTFVLTSIEVAMSYLKIEYFTNVTLLVLAVAKFSLVAMFFMHLRFDNPVLRRLFLTGIIVAFSVYLVVILTLGVFGGTHK